MPREITTAGAHPLIIDATFAAGINIVLDVSAFFILPDGSMDESVNAVVFPPGNFAENVISLQDTPVRIVVDDVEAPEGFLAQFGFAMAATDAPERFVSGKANSTAEFYSAEVGHQS